MRTHRVLAPLLLAAGVTLASGASAQPVAGAGARYPAETAQIVQADRDFAASVAQRNRERFLSFIADATTFNGGTAGEVHGRDAVLKDWADFFNPDGPTLSWSPTHGDVVGAGDVGYTTGTAVLRGKGPNGAPIERHSEYVTVWRRQKDGSWKVVFDTGSALAR
ncbi:MAG: DUF4440 domain-containing protein [Acidobacteria bacterium]|nr:DUF4440 domain-containing protein [Acidobacteriota bacterium]